MKRIVPGRLANIKKLAESFSDLTKYFDKICLHNDCLFSRKNNFAPNDSTALFFPNPLLMQQAKRITDRYCGSSCPHYPRSVSKRKIVFKAGNLTSAFFDRRDDSIGNFCTHLLYIFSADSTQESLIESSNVDAEAVDEHGAILMGSYCKKFQYLLASDWLHSQTEEEINLVKKILSRLEKRGFLSPVSPVSVAKWRGGKNKIKVLIGADPEFEVYVDGSIAEAFSVTPGTSPDIQVGCDAYGRQLEIRPRPSSNPRVLVKNIRELLSRANLFYDSISVKGNLYPLGGHLHFSIQYDPYLVDLLDDFIGNPLLDLGGTARGHYKELHAFREQPHGFEYRTPPAVWCANPIIARIIVKLARNIAEYWFKNKSVEYNYPLELEDYKRIGGLKEQEYQYFIDFIKQKEVNPPLEATWKLKPPFKVKFKDDWAPLAKNILKSSICKELSHQLPYSKKFRIVFFGLKRNRDGDIYGFDSKSYRRVSDLEVPNHNKPFHYGFKPFLRSREGTPILQSQVTSILHQITTDLVKLNLLRLEEKAVYVEESTRPIPINEPIPEPSRNSPTITATWNEIVEDLSAANSTN